MIYQLKNLINHAKTTSAEINGKWVPARPISGGWRFKLRAAWLCLSGKADAVIWPEGQ